MPKQEEPLWTIADLGAQVALALSVDYQGAPNGRVRDVPDPRSIRYYVSFSTGWQPGHLFIYRMPRDLG